MLLELVKVALGHQDRLSHIPTTMEWESIYDESIKQSVAGVAFEGIQKLPKEQRPAREQLFKWIGISESIRKQNDLLYKRSVGITQLFASNGFVSCILKGQGNAVMYPNPYSRMSGDIDIWVYPVTSGNNVRVQINNYVKARFPDAEEQEEHIDFPVFKDAIVEVHYKPAVLLSRNADRRFQLFCEMRRSEQVNNLIDFPNGVGRVAIPTNSFNMVFQMVHMMNHFFTEGIGLRHFIDYYYVLKKPQIRGVTQIKEQFERLGLHRFAKGVMWVEKECLGLGDEYLIIEPDSRAGRIILTEMMSGGNFGHHDERYKIRKLGYFARGITDIYRLMKLATVFPSESMWKVIRKIENQKWKLKASI